MLHSKSNGSCFYGITCLTQCCSYCAIKMLGPCTFHNAPPLPAINQNHPLNAQAHHSTQYTNNNSINTIPVMHHQSEQYHQLCCVKNTTKISQYSTYQELCKKHHNLININNAVKTTFNNTMVEIIVIQYVPRQSI